MRLIVEHHYVSKQQENTDNNKHTEEDKRPYNKYNLKKA